MEPYGLPTLPGNLFYAISQRTKYLIASADATSGNVAANIFPGRMTAQLAADPVPSRPGRKRPKLWRLKKFVTISQHLAFQSDLTRPAPLTAGKGQQKAEPLV